MSAGMCAGLSAWVGPGLSAWVGPGVSARVSAWGGDPGAPWMARSLQPEGGRSACGRLSSGAKSNFEETLHEPA